MKITKNELKQLVQEAVKAKLQEENGSDFTAGRLIKFKAEETSMNFEAEIISLLNLKNN